VAFIGKKVTLVSREERLIPMADPALSDFIRRILAGIGVKLLLRSEISGWQKDLLLLSDGTEVPCDLVVNSEMRSAVLPESDLELERENGFLKVNEHHQTNYPNIFAIGDVNGKMPLAHVGSAQGLAAVNFLNKLEEPLDYLLQPLNIYTAPELAQVGYTEPQLQEAGREYKVSVFPLAANGKALTEGERQGFVRVLSGDKYGEILGVQIAAAHATDMIAEAQAIMQMEGTIYDMTRIVHAHPTISEVMLEVGMVARDQPIHI
jgi:dihydrolipoamide dehydrogenase